MKKNNRKIRGYWACVKASRRVPNAKEWQSWLESIKI
jgi:hypothetical protein